MFFFTDLDKLNPQAASQAFGPVPGEENNKFLVSNKFTIKSDAKAYSALAGTILVQPVDNDPTSTVVNVALKPISPVVNGYTPINYIIYRGIKKSSIIDQYGTIVNETKSDLAALLWRTWRKAQQLPGHDASTSPSLDAIGWHPVNAGADTPLRNFFGKNDFGFQLPTLAEGKSIGVFDSTADIGIDIILADPLVVPTLGLLQGSTNVVAIPVAANSVYNQPPAVKQQREQVLAYLDVCLFYALQAEKGVKFWLSSSNSALRALGDEELYQAFFDKFYGKNFLYLDIRNETSLSLNHYNEYLDEQERPGIDSIFYLSTTAAEPEPFAATWPWPLFRVDPLGSDVVTLAFKTKKFRNQDPLLYREYGQFGPDLPPGVTSQDRFASLYLDGYGLIPGAVERSKKITFAVPVLAQPNSTSKVNRCAVIKLMLVRRTVPALTLPGQANTAVIPQRRNYLDNIFGPITDLATARPRETYAKRWMSMGDLASGTLIGAIVEPSRSYDDTRVLFKAVVLDSYASPALGTGADADLSPYGRDVRGLTTISTYGSGLIGQAWEASELGDTMRRVILSTNSGADIPVLVPSAPDTPAGAVSIYVTRSQYDTLLRTATANFDTQLLDTSLYFTPFTLETTLETNPLSQKKQVYSSTITLGGATTGGFYVTMTEDLTPVKIRVYSLDGLHFNSEESGQASTVTLDQAPVAEYTTGDYTDDVRTIERVYATNDTRIDQTVTRLRVHYYGFSSEDAPGLDTATGYSGKYGNLIDGRTTAGKGYLFNLNVPKADYWESFPGGLCRNSLLGVIPPIGLAEADKVCRVRQVHRGDAGISEALFARIGRKAGQVPDLVRSGVLLGRNGTGLVDPGNTIVDMGHTLYTLDALFTAPVFPDRDDKPTPSTGFVAFGMKSSVLLANYIGDITGTLGVSYNLYYNKFGPNNSAFQQRYSRHDFIEEQYDITSPLPDLVSDADGFALYAVWKIIFKQDPATKLSKVLAYYYSTDPDNNIEYTYKSRWKLFALGAGFLRLEAGSYYWRPDMDELRKQMAVGYAFGYLAEAESMKLAFYLGSGGITQVSDISGRISFDLGKEALKRIYLKQLDDADMNYVLLRFLTQIKGLLVQEQATRTTIH